MAHCKQALKRCRTNEKSRIRNKSRKSELSTLEKKVRNLVAGNDSAAASEACKTFCSRMDKAANSGCIHKNKADRKKGQLMSLLNSVKA